MEIDVIITGATGMVGEGVLFETLFRSSEIKGPTDNLEVAL